MKITLTRLLETSKYLATEVGQAIPGFFDYMAEFVEQVTRSLRSGLTFSDNFDCDIKTVSLKHNTEQIISSNKSAIGIIPIRVISQGTGLDSFAWWYSDQGNLTLKASFTGSPTAAQSVVVVVLF